MRRGVRWYLLVVGMENNTTGRASKAGHMPLPPKSVDEGRIEDQFRTFGTLGLSEFLHVLQNKKIRLAYNKGEGKGRRCSGTSLQ